MEQDYIRAKGIIYKNEILSIKKSANSFQPIFEAFTNAWEAIMERFGTAYFHYGKIDIRLYMDVGMFEDVPTNTLNRIEIKDNGAGLNNSSFERLVNLRDNTKSVNNKGTGRIQLLHYFDTTTFDSISKAKEGYEHIVVKMSKKDSFLANNAILFQEVKEPTTEEHTGTIVTFQTILDTKRDSQKYNSTSPSELKQELINHYLSKFCENKERLPQIKIEQFLGNDKEKSIVEEIKPEDIPNPEHIETFSVKKSMLSGNKVVDSVSSEEFTLLSFCQDENQLASNSIYYVSNGALAQKNPVDVLQPKDSIDGKRYIFLLRSNYFDSVDDDLRGELKLVKESEFKKQNESSLFPEECILIDHVKDATNRKISELYPAFQEKKDIALRNLEELKEMFLIDEEIIASFRKKVKAADTDESILQSIYESDCELTAKRDAELKREYKELEALAPDQNDYQELLSKHVDNVVKLIPQQNKVGLSKYIARRKLVLEIFDMILSKELNKLSDNGKINEALLHNLIFQQHSSDPSNSDLWLLDDMYLYYKGCSESEMDKIEIDGTFLIKKDLTEEESTYKVRDLYDDKTQDMGDQRPDIFLFPQEGKCIIIEFKAPNVDVSKHLDQINRYARLINNLSDEKFKFNSFYGYLIGENINYDNISDANPYFKYANNLGYIYRPDFPVKGKFNRADGNLYTEIIKYSDILKRAKIRNRIFMDKLGL